jgi:hypothetical protein
MTENVEKIREHIHEDRHRTIHELADTAGISYGVCQILTENLNMCHIATKFVPQLLTNYQKQRSVNLCLEVREMPKEDPTFTRISRIITGDKSWIYGYYPETKQLSSQSPQSSSGKKGAAGPEFNKKHAHCFLDMKGFVHHEFVPPNTTVNSNIYCDVLKHLRENVQ